MKNLKKVKELIYDLKRSPVKTMRAVLANRRINLEILVRVLMVTCVFILILFSLFFYLYFNNLYPYLLLVLIIFVVVTFWLEIYIRIQHNIEERSHRVIEEIKTNNQNSLHVRQELYNLKLDFRSIYGNREPSVGKINMTRINNNYFERNSCLHSKILRILTSFHSPKGINLVVSMEKEFLVKSSNEFDQSLFQEPWVGIYASPLSCHPFFGLKYKNVFDTEMWQQAKRQCLGIFCFDRTTKQRIEFQTGIKTNVLQKPITNLGFEFDIVKFLGNPHKKIIQLGNKFSKVSSIYNLPLNDFEKVFLAGGLAEDEFVLLRKKELASSKFKSKHSHVSFLKSMKLDDYNNLLSKNLAFLDLWDASANSKLLECIVGNIPVLVNPLPAVIEHLGEKYPFYFNTLEEAAQKARNSEIIIETYQYLKNLKNKERYSEDSFLKSFLESDIYKALK